MDITNAPCPICGQSNYEFGYLEQYQAKSMLHTMTKNLFFRPASQAKNSSMIGGLLRSDKPYQVKARHCLNCGNLAIFTDTKSP